MMQPRSKQPWFVTALGATGSVTGSRYFLRIRIERELRWAVSVPEFRDVAMLGAD